MWLPGFLIRRRLTTKALDLLHLDRALDSLGLEQLSDEEMTRVRSSLLLFIKDLAFYLMELSMSENLSSTDLCDGNLFYAPYMKVPWSVLVLWVSDIMMSFLGVPLSGRTKVTVI